MSTFSPVNIVRILKLSEPEDTRQLFEKNWFNRVKAQVEKWCPRRDGHQSGGRTKGSEEEKDSQYRQLEFTAHIVEYVNYLYKRTNVPAGSKNTSTKLLPDEVPILGPRFLPPDSYLEAKKCQFNPDFTPDGAYLKPVNIVHPFYFGDRLLHCPNIGPSATATEKHEVAWDGWTTTGHREVHGLSCEETALGYQLRCKTCQKASPDSDSGEKVRFCFATTSGQFWRLYEHWEIPRQIPYFLHRCAVTRELYNWLIELRPSSTASGMEEHIRQSHLLQYSLRKLEYMNYLKESQRPGRQMTLDGGLKAVKAFSAPMNRKGYNDHPISNDLISDVYLDFVRRTREAESSAYLRTLSCVTISFDHTFKLAKKAKVVRKDGSRENLLGGGLFSAINERNEIILWAFCQTTSGEEFGKSLSGLGTRCDVQEVPRPISATSDICCKVRRPVQKALTTSTDVFMDTNHFGGRYASTVQDKTSNPFYHAVWQSITDAILEERATPGRPAVYRSKDEQVRHLEATYKRWEDQGGVWTAASVKCHTEQLKHVKKGCLARMRNDVRSDGSRIESTHKGWNSLMRASPSGLEMLVALGHDHVLRRNMRVILRSKEFTPPPFLESTFGSHHIALVNRINMTWNTIIAHHRNKRTTGSPSHALESLPEMPVVDSGEKFGLIVSDHIATFGGLWEVKEEDDEDHSLNNISDLPEEPQQTTSLVVRQATTVSVTSEIIPDLPHMPSASPSPRPLEPLEIINLDARSSPEVIDIDASVPSSNQTVINLDAPAPSVSSEVIDLDAPSAVDVPAPLSAAENTTTASTSTTQGVAESTGQHGALSPAERDAISSPTLEVAAPAPNVSPLGSDGVRPIEQASRKRKECTIDDEPRKEIRIGGPTKRARIEPSGDGVTGETVHEFFRLFGRGGATTNAHAPNGAPTTAASTPQEPLPNDQKASTAAVATATAVSTSTCTLSSSSLDLTSSLPPPRVPGLTRSEAIFAIATGVDSRSLKIERGELFFLFMSLRAQKQWATSRMTSSGYVKATKDYNEQYTGHCRNQGIPCIPKNPRAIVDLLSSMEKKILERIRRDDYKSKTSGSEAFWRRHCAAVALGEGDTPLGTSSEGGRSGAGTKRTRAPAICSRCKCIMYPKGKSSGRTVEIGNHKRGVCLDGFPVNIATLKREDGTPEVTQPVLWPQPSGVFQDGKKFDPVAFLKAVRYIYVKGHLEPEPEALSMEQETFAKLLVDRCVKVNGSVLFRTFPQLQVIPYESASQYICEFDGVKHIRIDCLRDEQDLALPATDNSGLLPTSPSTN